MASSISNGDGTPPHPYTQPATVTRPSLSQDMGNHIAAAITTTLKTQLKAQVTRDLIIRERRVARFNQKVEVLMGKQCTAIQETSIIEDEKTYGCTSLASLKDQLTNKDTFRCCVSDNLLTGVILFNSQCKCLNRSSISSAWSLLSNYGDINAQRENLNSNTALMELVKAGDVDIIDFLLRNGADASAINDYGEYPLHVAAEYGYLDIAKKLRVSGSCDLLEQNSQTPLHKAAEKGHLDVTKWLLASEDLPPLPDDVGQMPLHKASINDHAAVAEALVEKNSDLEIIDHENMTPLHLAALNRCENVLKRFLAWGADIHAVNTAGDTPLHLAFMGNKPVSLISIAFLLYYNADPLADNDDSQRPVDLATKAIEKALLEIPIEPVYERPQQHPSSLEEKCKNLIWCTILDAFCNSGKATQEQFFTEILPYFIIDSTTKFSSGKIIRGFRRDLLFLNNRFQHLQSGPKQPS